MICSSISRILMEGVEDWEENKGLIGRASSRYFGTRFKISYPGYNDLYYDRIIEKMLGCGDVAYGYSSYMCFHCGWDERKIAFSCNGS